MAEYKDPKTGAIYSDTTCTHLIAGQTDTEVSMRRRREGKSVDGTWCFEPFVIPDTVKTIGNEAFSCRKGLNGITIPNSVISIGDDAFYGCFRLSAIYISPGSPVYNAVKARYGKIVVTI